MKPEHRRRMLEFLKIIEKVAEQSNNVDHDIVLKIEQLSRRMRRRSTLTDRTRP